MTQMLTITDLAMMLLSLGISITTIIITFYRYDPEKGGRTDDGTGTEDD